MEGKIVLDGRLDEPAWKQACRVDRWFETSPGDNTPPPVASLAYLAYDDRSLYVGFDLADPDPSNIRAPLGDRDSLTGFMDHVGIVLDTRGDGKTAMIFAASARGVQYDSQLDDSRETDDRAPDYSWDTAIGANERFALLYPEKRPFFLEGSDLFATKLSYAFQK